MPEGRITGVFAFARHFTLLVSIKFCPFGSQVTLDRTVEILSELGQSMDLKPSLGG